MLTAMQLQILITLHAFLFMIFFVRNSQSNQSIVYSAASMTTLHSNACRQLILEMKCRQIHSTPGSPVAADGSADGQDGPLSTACLLVVVSKQVENSAVSTRALLRTHCALARGNLRSYRARIASCQQMQIWLLFKMHFQQTILNKKSYDRSSRDAGQCWPACND